jgi:hypothetical protein
MRCPQCLSRGWYPLIRPDGAHVSERCACPAGVELGELPVLEQLPAPERRLLIAVKKAVERRVKKRTA